MKIKIISGGQTGADIAGLRLGKLFGFETGGTAPKGFLTVDGLKPELAKFGLVEGMGGYRDRTIVNVKAAHMTLVFSKNMKSPGTILTINSARKLQKPHFMMQDVRELGETLVDFWSSKRTAHAQLEQAQAYLHKHKIIFDTEEFVINVAGNATKNAKESFEFAFMGLWLLLTEVDDRRIIDIRALGDTPSDLRSLHALAIEYKDRYDD